MGNHSFVINDGPIWWSCSSTAAGIVVLDSGEIIPEETITAVRLDDLYLLEEREI